MNTLPQTLGGLAFVFMIGALIAGFLPAIFGRFSYPALAALALSAIVGVVLLSGEVLDWWGAVTIGFFVLNLMSAIGTCEHRGRRR